MSLLIFFIASTKTWILMKNIKFYLSIFKTMNDGFQFLLFVMINVGEVVFSLTVEVNLKDNFMFFHI